MNPPDEIRIASLELRAHVGVPAAERKKAQRLTVSLTMVTRRFCVGGNRNGSPFTHREMVLSLLSCGTSARRGRTIGSMSAPSRKASDSAVAMSGANCLKLRPSAPTRASVAYRTIKFTTRMTTTPILAAETNGSAATAAIVEAVRNGNTTYQRGCAANSRSHHRS